MRGAAASGLWGIPSPHLKLMIVNDEWTHKRNVALIHGLFEKHLPLGVHGCCSATQQKSSRGAQQVRFGVSKTPLPSPRV